MITEEKKSQKYAGLLYLAMAQIKLIYEAIGVNPDDDDVYASIKSALKKETE